MLEQARGFHIVAVAEVVNTRKTVAVTTGELFGEIVERLAFPQDDVVRVRLCGLFSLYL